ncbi:MAG TPA: carbohydrate porin [Steroidobacteraceae bacterium]|nr:carbohydrate porin [Steroidobacteraceae bacterium]
MQKTIWLLAIVTAVARAAPDAAAYPPNTVASTGTRDDITTRFSVYGQATYVEQDALGFHAPYSGPNSLSPHMDRETTDVTLFLGARLWPGAEMWVNPEIDQGFGLDNTLGLAGFPSGEAYKIGKNQPYFRLPRAFVRQTLNLDDQTEPVDGGPNQFARYRSPNRLVVTIGKLSVVDLFDTNQYAHDPRSDFLNWAIVDAGAFDYAADAWGYTIGAAVEWYEGSWTLRAGVFDLSDVPNSTRLDPGMHEFQMVAEIEHRHEILGAPGRVLLTAFDSRGRMGLLDDAVNLARQTGAPVDITAVRRYRSRLGGSFGIEQAISADVGVFARVSKAAGNVEAYEFTDIDRSFSTGVSVKGSEWKRPHDTVGLAAVVNGISAERERYLNAGGLGILIGDGRLPDPGAERILESYYQLSLGTWLQITADYQHVTNPAYNRDRGPVSIVSLRVHVQF